MEAVDPVAAVAQRPVADLALDDLHGRFGQEGVERRQDDPGDLSRRAEQDRRAPGNRYDGRDGEAADRDPERIEPPEELDLGSDGVEPDLLLGLT